MHIAIRMARLGTETAFEVLAKAKALEAKGKSVVHLEIGEPDFDTPQNIKKAAIDAINNGFTHYGPSAGLPEHREAIAEYISETRGITVDPDEVVVTPGAKPIIFFTILTWLRPGDEVLTPSPGFPIYESMINFVGAKPVLYPLREENNFDVDIDEFKKLVSPMTKMIILNSPQNPTGSVLSKETLHEISRIVQEDNDILVISDEVYSEMIYEGEHSSIASIDGMKDRTVIIDGYSKTFAMTGWRCGYGIMNKDLAKYVAQLQTNSTSCTATFTQIASIEALKGPKDAVKKMVSEFKNRRNHMIETVNSINNLSTIKPNGAFYCWINVSKIIGKKFGAKIISDSMVLTDILLTEAKVAVVPGYVFGDDNYVRLSYATSLKNISEGLQRIKEFVEKL